MIVLIIFGIMYLGLGLWCTFSPEGTAAWLGLAFERTSGKIEYLVVYGGLELGLGVFFLLCAFNKAWIAPGLTFALISSALLAAYRLTAILTLKGGSESYSMLAGEITITLLAALGLWLHLK